MLPPGAATDRQPEAFTELTHQRFAVITAPPASGVFPHWLEHACVPRPFAWTSLFVSPVSGFDDCARTTARVVRAVGARAVARAPIHCVRSLCPRINQGHLRQVSNVGALFRVVTQ